MKQVFEALSASTRRRVLRLLRHGPMTAGELVDEFELSKTTMSAHISILREANLIDVDKQGTTTTYRLKISVLEDALLSLAEAFRSVLDREAHSPAASWREFHH